jgi:hypothetical protein
MAVTLGIRSIPNGLAVTVLGSDLTHTDRVGTRHSNIQVAFVRTEVLNKTGGPPEEL